MDYKFYGNEKEGVFPINKEYLKIKNQRVLYDLLSDIWCKETCTPRMRDGWSEENKTLGQCSITAFLAQEVFGGKVYGIKTEGENYHCFNEVNGVVFDLTSEQFGNKTLNYDERYEQFKSSAFKNNEEKKLRYLCLKEELLKKLK